MRFSLQKILALSLATLSLLASAPALGDTALYSYHVGGWDMDKAHTAFMAAHPEIQFVMDDENWYYTTGEMINGLVTGSFQYDLFELSTYSMDAQQLMAKGYCVDLSGSDALMAAAQRLWPNFREACMAEGKLYGFPVGLTISAGTYDPAAWEEAGLTPQEVPTSYTELLDFLEAWVARTETEDLRHIAVCNNFDGTLYNAGSYIRWLTEYLMDTYIMQADKAGQSLRFDTPELRALLERTQAVGREIYLAEPGFSNPEAGPNAQYGLFELNPNSYTLPGATAYRGMDYVMPQRITSDQPPLVRASLDIACVGAGGASHDLAISYLENKVSYMDNDLFDTGTYIFANSTAPLKDEAEVAADIARQEGFIAETKRQLAADPNDAQAERALFNQTRILKEMQAEDYRYRITPQWLAGYQRYAPTLYFAKPTPFSMGMEQSYNMEQLIQRFAMNQLTLDELIKQMDRIAQMVEAENKES